MKRFERILPWGAHAAVFIGLPGKAIYMIDRFWNTEDWEYVQSRR